MITLQVNDMTCGRCVAHITRAVKAVDPDAALEFELASRQVRVGSALENSALVAAISGAGYTPVLLSGPARIPVVASPRAGSGCCCG